MIKKYIRGFLAKIHQSGYEKEYSEIESVIAENELAS